jgi:hypothetical protein
MVQITFSIFILCPVHVVLIILPCQFTSQWCLITFLHRERKTEKHYGISVLRRESACDSTFICVRPRCHASWCECHHLHCCLEFETIKFVFEIRWTFPLAFIVIIKMKSDKQRSMWKLLTFYKFENWIIQLICTISCSSVANCHAEAWFKFNSQRQTILSVSIEKVLLNFPLFWTNEMASKMKFFTFNG